MVRNFVPAKNSSNVIGMYDLVEGKFYTNQGTGTFTAGAEQKSGSGISLAYDTTNKTNNKVDVAVLPAGYTQLEYIESTGTQYINTGVNITTTDDYSVQMSCMWTDITTRNLMGYNALGYAFFAVEDDGYYASGTTKTPNVKASTTSYDNLDFYGKNGNNYGLLVNGTDIKREVGWTSGEFRLFSLKDYEYQSSKVKMQFCRMVLNNQLVRNFIPAKNASGTLGMYDLVEGKFYTNAGTGTFLAGDEVNQLKLLLKNEDLGSSFGVRYKVTFYAATASGKVELSSSISGMSVPTSSSNGFVFNSTDGYYYYQNSAGTNVVFEPATSSGVTSKYLMTGFSIDYTNATKTLLGGNSIYMEISIESVNLG